MLSLGVTDQPRVYVIESPVLLMAVDDRKCGYCGVEVRLCEMFDHYCEDDREREEQ